MRLSSVLVSALTITAAFSSASPAHAQRSYTLYRGAPTIRGSLVSGARTWTVGNPEMVLGPGVTHVLPSPDFKHLLIARETRPLTPRTTTQSADKSAPGEITLTWWNVRTRRTREVWRYPISPEQSVGLWMNGWLGKTGSAMFRFVDGKDARVLFVNPVMGQVKETILPSQSYGFLNVSPTQPFAALAGPEGACKGEVRFIGRDGTIGEPIPLPIPSKLFFTRWSEDGTWLRGVGNAPGPDGKQVEQWYAVDPAKRTVTAIPPPPKAANGEDEYDNFGDPAEGLPIRLAPDKETRSLYIETLPQSKSRVLLSADGDPVFLLPDGSGAFFRRDGALYFAPIVSAPAPGDGVSVPDADKKDKIGHAKHYNRATG